MREYPNLQKIINVTLMMYNNYKNFKMNTSNKTFKAGTYYIGDLCYIIDTDENWSKICNSIETDLAMSYTAYGDGLYKDNNKKYYSVDSGTIGIISTDHQYIDKEKLEQTLNKEHARVVIFDNDFVFKCTNGKFQIGTIKINTT